MPLGEWSQEGSRHLYMEHWRPDLPPKLTANFSGAVAEFHRGSGWISRRGRGRASAASRTLSSSSISSQAIAPVSRILATGTPEEVAAVKDPWTGRFLLQALKGGRSR